jgi:molybdate transport system regulatory protein
MAGPKGSKYYDVFLDYKVWLTHRERGDHLDDHLVSLLSEIKKGGSIRAAADQLGLSYRKAWGDIREAEGFLGFQLLEKVRGGKDGGLSRLTAEGDHLVEAFRQLHEGINQSIHDITKRFFHQLNNRESGIVNSE